MLFEKMSKEENKVVSVSFPLSILEEVDRRRSLFGFSRSVYIRLALQDYFRKEDNRQK